MPRQTSAGTFGRPRGGQPKVVGTLHVPSPGFAATLSSRRATPRELRKSAPAPRQTIPGAGSAPLAAAHQRASPILAQPPPPQNSLTVHHRAARTPARWSRPTTHPERRANSPEGGTQRRGGFAQRTPAALSATRQLLLSRPPRRTRTKLSARRRSPRFLRAKSVHSFCENHPAPQKHRLTDSPFPGKLLVNPPSARGLYAARPVQDSTCVQAMDVGPATLLDGAVPQFLQSPRTGRAHSRRRRAEGGDRAPIRRKGLTVSVQERSDSR